MRRQFTAKFYSSAHIAIDGVCEMSKKRFVLLHKDLLDLCDDC